MDAQAEGSGTGVFARSQRAIVNVYTVIALLYCAASTWLYYQVAGVPFLGHVHLVSFAVIAVNYVVLQRTGDYAWATHTILAVGTLVVSSQFALGGWGGTGYLWTFAYLPYAFFLATPAIARLWVAILVLVDSMLVAADLVGGFTLAYPRCTVGDVRGEPRHFPPLHVPVPGRRAAQRSRRRRAFA